jgi:DNA adenine methylase
VKYMGGKAGTGQSLDLGREIVNVIYALTPSNLFLDICCGALNVSRHVKGADRIGIDACRPLITTLKAALGGWSPPESVSKELWQWYRKYGSHDDPLTGFLMFGRSYGGRAWEGFSPDTYKKENRGAYAKASLLSRVPDCLDMQLFCLPYWEVPDPPPGAIIYCDPPYIGTKPYKHVGSFDHDHFWTQCTYWHLLGCHVYVSEGENANPPQEWIILKEWIKTVQIRKDGIARNRIERLYVHKDLRA